MDPEKTRSRPPTGLFSDDSSSPSAGERRSVSDPHPYRGTRESLIARRQALQKELAAVDTSLEEARGEEAAAATMPSTGLGDLGSIFFPRRAMSVVMAGVLAGVGISSLFAYQLGVSWSDPDPGARTVVVDSAHRSERRRPDETAAQHALRRRKEGEALLMSSLFASPASESAAAARIRRIGPTTWQVDQSVLERADSPSMSLRMLPHLARDGRVDGIQLFGIRPDGVQARLGLQNGDILLRANGIEVTGADGAFAAAESVRRTRYLTLELRRGGTTVAQHYLIATS
jgi:hypothetical protein